MTMQDDWPSSESDATQPVKVTTDLSSSGFAAFESAMSVVPRSKKLEPPFELVNLTQPPITGLAPAETVDGVAFVAS